MSSESLRTLFYPFEAGTLALPSDEDRILFLEAEPGFRLPAGWSGPIEAVQGFRPHFRALQAARVPVAPRAEGEGYAVALVLAGRHRGRNELDVAEAMARTRPGGLVVVAGSKDDGIASLRKRLAQLVGIEGSEPKYHGIVFWFRNEGTQPAVEALRQANPAMLVDGRFHTAPGMFSFDRIDAGSRLLAGHLPSDLRGAVADFCAGWGYLAAETAAGNPGMATLDLYEADFAALEAARRNLEAVEVGKEFFWHDLAAEPVGRRYDAIVMNPPFHHGRAADPGMGQAIIRAAAKALKPGGRLFMVANRQLPYEQVLASAFSSFEEIGRDAGFKVFSARR